MGKKLTVIVTCLALFSSAYAFYKELKKDITPDKTLGIDIEITYLNIKGDLYALADSDSSLRKQDRFYMEYPTAHNEILDQQLVSDNDSISSGFIDDQYITFLVIENRSKVDITDIVIDLTSYHITDTLKIDENTNSDYQDQIKKTGHGRAKSLELPQMLIGGQGIKIPLFISSKQDYRNTDPKKWNIISKQIYLPNKIIFKDPFSEKIKTKFIRKIRYPVALSSGIEVRG